MPADKLILPRPHWQAIQAHVANCWPEEACGLLGGAGGRVEQVYLIENMRHSRSEYQMAPTAQVKAMLDLEAHGWDLIGIFHSHPAGPALPSDTDVAQAYYPDAVYVIVAPSSAQAWEPRAFHIEAGQVGDVELIIEA